jgi:hypothetical protein
LATRKKKKANQSKRQKKASAHLKQNFSATQKAGGSVQNCPLKKHIPCNLVHLTLTEPTEDPEGKAFTRTVQLQPDPALHRQSSPIRLQSGGVFQITAHSELNPPRTVSLNAITEAVCGGTHPQLVFLDADGPDGMAGAHADLKFSRQPMSCDSGMPGLWTVVNSVFMQSPVTYPLSAATCGVPASKPAVASLGGSIQVYPADMFELEFSIPAILKPDALSYETQNKGWKTEAEKKDEEVDEVGDRASKAWKNSTELQAEGSEGAFREKFEDMKKRQLGVEDSSYVDEIEVSLTQTDGTRELEAPIDDVIVLVRAILSAEYAVKKIDEWIENFQVGPGVSFSIECQFLAGRINAQWGYTEYTDERVFMYIAGGIKIDLIKVSMDVNAGWKCAGLADAFLKLEGEGTISLNLPSVEKNSPDEFLEASVKPEGELELSGGIHGALGWVITGDIGFEVTFKADVDDFKVLHEDSILSGKIVISREPVYGVYTASIPLYGTTTDRIELIPGNPEVGAFEFGEA